MATWWRLRRNEHRGGGGSGGNGERRRVENWKLENNIGFWRVVECARPCAVATCVRL